MLKIILLLVLTSGCSYFDRSNEPNDSNNIDFEALQKKFDAYLELSQVTKDENGWITDKCDALLHTALYAVAGGTEHKNLLKGRNSSGQWFRRVSMDCLSGGGSKSTISRDMLLGLAVSIAVAKDLDTISELLDYARAHDFRMGDNDGSIDGVNRVYLTPTLYSLLLGVEDYIEDKRPEVMEFITHEDNQKTELLREYGFGDHLDVLSIFLKGYINAGITNAEKERLGILVGLDPNNALIHAVKSKYQDGNQVAAYNILMREDLFPSDRLPDSSDHCTDYLWMHGEDEIDDWSPCNDRNDIHPGHDFLIAAWIILDAKGGQ